MNKRLKRLERQSNIVFIGIIIVFLIVFVAAIVKAGELEITPRLLFPVDTQQQGMEVNQGYGIKAKYDMFKGISLSAAYDLMPLNFQGERDILNIASIMAGYKHTWTHNRFSWNLFGDAGWASIHDTHIQRTDIKTTYTKKEAWVKSGKKHRRCWHHTWLTIPHTTVTDTRIEFRGAPVVEVGGGAGYQFNDRFSMFLDAGYKYLRLPMERSVNRITVDKDKFKADAYMVFLGFNFRF